MKAYYLIKTVFYCDFIYYLFACHSVGNRCTPLPTREAIVVDKISTLKKHLHLCTSTLQLVINRALSVYIPPMYECLIEEAKVKCHVMKYIYNTQCCTVHSLLLCTNTHSVNSRWITLLFTTNAAVNV